MILILYFIIFFKGTSNVCIFINFVYTRYIYLFIYLNTHHALVTFRFSGLRHLPTTLRFQLFRTLVDV